MSYVIFSDSSSNLTDSMIDDLQVEIVSLSYNINGEIHKSYIKGANNDLKNFYNELRTKIPITTSCVNEEEFYEAFKNYLEKGEDLLYIGFSSGISNTYQMGHHALERLKKEFPKRKIYDVDTLAASMGEGLLVYYAATMKKNGSSIEEVKNWLEDNKLKLVHWFTIDDLFFLRRGGRIAASSYIIGSLANIKPIMHVDNAGKLIPMAKVQGRKKSLHTIVNNICDAIVNPEDQYIFISHGDCIEDVNYCINKIKEKINVKGFVTNYVDPVVGIHSGPGTMAIFCLGKER